MGNPQYISSLKRWTEGCIYYACCQLGVVANSNSFLLKFTFYHIIIKLTQSFDKAGAEAFREKLKLYKNTDLTKTFDKNFLLQYPPQPHTRVHFLSAPNFTT
jgi:hypothetical protein